MSETLSKIERAVKRLESNGYEVTRIPVGKHVLGAVEIYGFTLVFRMNDNGGGPGDGPSAGCTFCKMWNAAHCQSKIPPEYPPGSPEAKKALADCIAEACAKDCGPVDDGPVIIM